MKMINTAYQWQLILHKILNLAMTILYCLILAHCEFEFDMLAILDQYDQNKRIQEKQYKCIKKNIF